MAEEPAITSNHAKRRKDGGTTSHIRFDQEDDDTETGMMSSDSPTPRCSHDAYTSKKDKPPKNKRKRNHPAATSKGGSAKCSKRIFNGLIVAISTLESKQTNTNNGDCTDKDSDDDPYQNYKALKNLLQSHGATISPQVHKRVHYLISTEAAVQNLTQRVRQALKRDVDIIDVAWVKECKGDNKRMDVQDHLCNELAQCLMAEKEKEKRMKSTKEDKVKGDKAGRGECSDAIEDENSGWSTPVQLDCCCVCHENGDDNCPWCTVAGSECNLTLERIEKLNNA